MIELFQEDCLSGIKNRLKSESVDIIVTSPPYNIGAKYNFYDDKKDEDEYLGWLAEIFSELYRVLKPDGHFFLNIGSRPSNALLPHLVLEKAVGPLGMFALQNTIHWIKSISIDGVGSWGHFKPINSPHYFNDCHEYVFHLTKGGDSKLARKAIGVPYQDKSNIARWKNAGDGLRCRGNTWFIPYPTIQHKKEHPATFPIQLPEMCIAVTGLTSGLVLDPFAGICTTGLAAKNLGLDFIGFEIDPIYTRIAQEELNKNT